MSVQCRGFSKTTTTRCKRTTNSATHFCKDHESALYEIDGNTDADRTCHNNNSACLLPSYAVASLINNPLLKVFSSGRQSVLYEVDGYRDWLIKVRKACKGGLETNGELSYETWEQVSGIANTLAQANLCRYVNRIIGCVKFLDRADSNDKRCWATVIQRVPNAVSLSSYIGSMTSSVSRVRQITELMSSAEMIARCLYKARIAVDTGGYNNVLVDRTTGYLYFVDIEVKLSQAPSQTENDFVGMITDYVKALMTEASVDEWHRKQLAKYCLKNECKPEEVRRVRDLW